MLSPARTEAVAVVESYLQGGLLAHDPDIPRLAPTCFRHENGWHTGTAEIIRRHFPHMTMCRGVRDVRWIVELPWVALRFELLLDEAYGATKPIAEWFLVGEGGIEEVAVVFPLARWMENALGPGSAEERAVRAAPERASREAGTVGLGDRVLAALATRSPGSMPLGDDASVTENGTLVAHGAPEVVDVFGRGIWPRVAAVAALQWVAEGSQAMARVELDLDDGVLLACALYVRTFDGLVREIDVRWGPGPSPDLVTAWRAAQG